LAEGSGSYKIKEYYLLNDENLRALSSKNFQDYIIHIFSKKLNNYFLFKNGNLYPKKMI